MTWRTRITVFVSLVFAACDGMSPTAPGKEWTPDAAVISDPTLMDAGQAQDFEIAPLFDPDHPTELLPEFIVVNGEAGLSIGQSWDRGEGRYVMVVRILNRGQDDFWRPIRLALTGNSPQALRLPPGDGPPESGSLPVWEYGQSIGSDGVLAPGETSDPRELEFLFPPGGIAAPHSFRLTLRLIWESEPSVAPSLIRPILPAEVEQGYANGRILVAYRGGSLTPDELARRNLELGFSGQDHDDIISGYIAHLDPAVGTTPEQAIARALAHPDIVWAGLDRVDNVISGLPSLNESNLRHLFQGNFRRAWLIDQAGGREPGQGVTVGVIDSGLDLSNGDFQGARITAVDCSRPKLLGGCEDQPDVLVGPHGTEVASVIAAASNGSLRVGGAYGVDLVSIKFTQDGSSNSWRRDMARALAYVRDRGDIDVLNFSSGFDRTRPESDFDQSENWFTGESLNDIVHDIVSGGTFFTAASGNEYTAYVDWPARHTDVVAVGGLDRNGTARRLSASYGPELDFVAVAEDVEVTTVGNTVAERNGTLFSAPQVAALAAILKAREPGLSPSQLKSRIIANHVVDVGEAGWDEETGWGRIIAAPAELPIPILYQRGVERVDIDGQPWLRYTLAVENWQEFEPAFAMVPEAYPFVDIREENGTRQQAFAALPSAHWLNEIYGGAEEARMPPRVYVEITDPVSGQTTRSDLLQLEQCGSVINVPSRPCGATLQSAINGAPDGATIFLEPGTYEARSLSRGPGLYVHDQEITIQGPGRDQVVIQQDLSGSSTMMVALLVNNSKLTLRGITLRGDTPDPQLFGYPVAISAMDSELHLIDVGIEGETLDYGGPGMLAEESSFAGQVNIQANSSTASLKDNSFTGPDGTCLGIVGPVRAEYNVFRDCTWQGNPAYAVEILRTGGTVRFNDFYGVEKAVRVLGEVYPDLTCNWWGTAGGPSYGGPGSQLADVYGTATYSPFATSPIAATSSTSCSGSPPRINLVATEVDGPSTGTPGEEVRVSFQVLNDGDASIPGGWDVGVYLSYDNVILDGRYLARWVHTKLGPRSRLLDRPKLAVRDPWLRDAR